MDKSLFHLKLSDKVFLSYVGPALEKGPLPTLFYLALSAKESLSLDPFNQLVQYLSSDTLRIFSMTLPGHGEGLDPTKALSVWAEEIRNGNNPIEEFVANLNIAIDHLTREGVLPGKIAIAGLSRGAFMATHAAAKIPLFHTLLGFAPITKLSYAKEFQNMQKNALVQALDLTSLVDSLIDRAVRFYIGNHDTRVSTGLCFQFIETLSEAAFQKKIRSPQVELIIGPSIGHQGHGTGPNVFLDGAKWISKHLGIDSDVR